MKKAQVTAQQVAQQAGVSPTTVSFVLNDVPGSTISEETKERVRQVAKDLGYVPHVGARALARGRSNNIGLVLIQPHFQVFTDPYVPNILTGMSEITHVNGLRILVEPIDSRERFSSIEDMLKGGEVAAVMIVNMYEVEGELVQLLKQGYPIVSLDVSTSSAIPSVFIDHADGVRQAVQHLIGLGHRRIACITYGPLHAATHITWRLGIYRQTLEEAGIPYDERLVRYGAFDPETGYKAMQSLLAETDRPTAVFGMNDMMALGAMTAVHEAGLRVPDDIAVVGYDDIRTARFAQPALTTVRAPERELGRLGASMAVDLIHGKTPEQTPVVLPSQLIIRNSCGASRALPDN